MGKEIELAWSLYESGRFDDALKLTKTLSELDASNADATYLYGCCLSQLGKHEDALSAYRLGLSYQPDDLRVFMAIGAALHALNHFDEAAVYYEKVLFKEPSHLLARVELAKVQASSGEYKVARNELLKASKFNPYSGLPHCLLGIIEQQKKSSSNKIHQCFLTAVKLEPDVTEYQYELGKFLLAQYQYDDAKKHLVKALNIEPDNSSVLAALVAVSVKQGEMDYAFEQIDKLRNREIFIPYAAISFLLCCKHGDRCDEAIEYAKSCLKDAGISSDDRRNINSKLATVFDNRKRYDKAWHHLLAGNSGDVASANYNPGRHKLYIDDLKETFNFVNMLNMPRANSQQQHSPIFIIGMPRSGTSLIEQILAAHSKVAAGGELPYIQHMVNGLPELTGQPRPWPQCILDTKQQNIDLLSQRYLTEIAQLSEQTQYVTDKMPHNFYYLGLIKLLFPKSKIIHCLRNPLDTCISIYFQNFKDGHEYSRNLFNLGTHYHQYQSIMAHWKSLMFDMHEIKYEELVHKPKDLIENMLEYCDLEWDDNCLNFHKVKRYVLTASFDQVREPLYTRSVNRWKHYEPYLDELNEGLKRGF